MSGLTELEKEELFVDFIVRMAEMDKEDKKLRVANNNSALKGMSRYYNEKSKEEKDRLWSEAGFRYYGMYQAYEKLRNAVIFMVNAKKHAEAIKDYKAGTLEYYKKVRETEKNMYSLNRNADLEEATKAGRILIDAMYKYFLEDEK